MNIVVCVLKRVCQRERDQIESKRIAKEERIQHHVHVYQ